MSENSRNRISKIFALVKKPAKIYRNVQLNTICPRLR